MHGWVLGWAGESAILIVVRGNYNCRWTAGIGGNSKHGCKPIVPGSWKLFAVPKDKGVLLCKPTDGWSSGRLPGWGVIGD